MYCPKGDELVLNEVFFRDVIFDTSFEYDKQTTEIYEHVRIFLETGTYHLKVDFNEMQNKYFVFVNDKNENTFCIFQYIIN